MNYIKARYEHSNRDYTFSTTDSVKVGDTVTNSKGQKLTVTGQADMAWVETYGADKLQEVHILKPKMKVSEIIDKMLDEECTCKYCICDGECPHGMACYGGEPVEPACTSGDYEMLFDYEQYAEDNNIEIFESEVEQHD